MAYGPPLLMPYEPFLLGVGVVFNLLSFLLTIELFCLQLRLGAPSLPLEPFLLTIGASLETIQAFWLAMGTYLDVAVSQKTQPGKIKISTSTVAVLFSKMALTGQRIAMVDMVLPVFPAFPCLP